MKIALYDAFGVKSLYEADEHRETSSAYCRLTEIVEVDLPPLPPEVTVPKQLAALDEAERELRMKFVEKLAEIANMRATIRALTHQTEAA